MKKVAGVAIAAGVTVATLAYAFSGVDLDALADTLLQSRLWVALPFVALLWVFFLTNAQRWGLMLRPFGRYSSSELMPSMMIGFAANNVLPLRVGELIRAYLFARQAGLSKSGVLMNLVLERLLDLIGILAIYAVGLLLMEETPSAFRASAWLATLAVCGLGIGIALLVLAPKSVERLWLRLSARLPESLRRRGSHMLEQFEVALRSMRDPGTALMLILFSIGRWLMPVLLVWLSIYAYGMHLNLPLAMVTLGITAFAASLPSVPGFIGPIQASFVFALTPFGVDQETALAASVFYLLGHWIPVTAAGAWLLAARHQDFRSVAAEAETEPGKSAS